MHPGELLYRISERGVSLRCGWSEDRLHYHPKDAAIEPELLDELRRHKIDVIRIANLGSSAITVIGGRGCRGQRCGLGVVHKTG